MPGTGVVLRPWIDGARAAASTCDVVVVDLYDSLAGSQIGPWPEIEVKQEKGLGRMPWLREAMKDVASCDKLRGVVNRL